MIVRLLPDPALDHLGVIAADQAIYFGEPAAHVRAFYLWRIQIRKDRRNEKAQV